jgi:hypothetical protein
MTGQQGWLDTFYVHEIVDPLRQVLHQPDSAEPMNIGKLRVGLPRQQWLFWSNEIIHTRRSHTEYDGDPFQNNNILWEAQQRIVWDHAKCRSILLGCDCLRLNAWQEKNRPITDHCHSAISTIAPFTISITIPFMSYCTHSYLSLLIYIYDELSIQYIYIWLLYLYLSIISTINHKLFHHVFRRA